MLNRSGTNKARTEMLFFAVVWFVDDILSP
jgi:hypothetical protein